MILGKGRDAPWGGRWEPVSEFKVEGLPEDRTTGKLSERDKRPGPESLNERVEVMCGTGLKESEIRSMSGIELAFWAVREARNSVGKIDPSASESSESEIVTVNFFPCFADERLARGAFLRLFVFVISGSLSNTEHPAPGQGTIRGNAGVDVWAESTAGGHSSVRAQSFMALRIRWACPLEGPRPIRLPLRRTTAPKSLGVLSPGKTIVSI